MGDATIELIDEAPPPDLLASLDAVVRSKRYIVDHRWMARRAAGRFVEAILLVVVPGGSIEDTDRRRAELDSALRAAEWRLDALSIVFYRVWP